MSQPKDTNDQTTHSPHRQPENIFIIPIKNISILILFKLNNDFEY